MSHKILFRAAGENVEVIKPSDTSLDLPTLLKVTQDFIVEIVGKSFGLEE